MLAGRPAPIVAKRVVEQESVRQLRAIIASEPDLVHAVVEAKQSLTSLLRASMSLR